MWQPGQSCSTETGSTAQEENWNDETALASEMAETMSSWGSEATAQFVVNSKFATKLMETKATKDFPCRDKVTKRRFWQKLLYKAFAL